MPAITRRLRAYLQEFTGGMSVKTIAGDLDLKPKSVATTINRMPDTYIVSWTRINNRWIRLWAIVTPPPDAPMPSRVDANETRARKR